MQSLEVGQIRLHDTDQPENHVRSVSKAVNLSLHHGLQGWRRRSLPELHITIMVKVEQMFVGKPCAQFMDLLGQPIRVVCTDESVA